MIDYISAYKSQRVFMGLDFEASGQLPPEENCPPLLGLEFGSRSGLVLGLGGNQAIVPPRKIAPWFGLGFGLGLVLRLGGNFPRGQLS